MRHPGKRSVATAIALGVVAVFMTAVPASATAIGATTASPNTGAPGTAVTLTGGAFLGTGSGGSNSDGTVNSVKFGSTAATFTVVNDTTITTTVPCSAGNTINLSNGTDTQTATFTVAAAGLPTVTSFSPTAGTAGVTSVVITGTNFCNASAVVFNATAATVKTVNSATQITATVPTGATTGTIKVTTPAGTGTSSASFTVGPPVITSFSPTIGLAGTTVTITGSNFLNATGVTFNGVTATFTVTSSTSISTTVPAGATTGPVRVTNAVGTATGATFTVGTPTHPRSVTFSYKGNRASGQVKVGDGFNACRAFVPVYIQQLRNGNWKLLDTTATNANGAYDTWVPDKSGKFRAQVKKLELADGSTCKGDASPTRPH